VKYNYHAIVPLVRFVRSRTWNNWEEFYNSLKINSQLEKIIKEYESEVIAEML
jgi:hypothetical protein